MITGVFLLVNKNKSMWLKVVDVDEDEDDAVSLAE